MPKAILEFTLPEDKYEFETAVRAMDYRILIEELLNHLRDLRKYKGQGTISISDIEDYIRNTLIEDNLPIL